MVQHESHEHRHPENSLGSLDKAIGQQVQLLEEANNLEDAENTIPPPGGDRSEGIGSVFGFF